MPSYPMGDGCCPHCGNLLIYVVVPGNLAIKLLPDTPENRRAAEAMVEEQLKLWEEVKNRKRSDKLEP